MQAPASIHPSDQTLRAFGNGQLDADAAEAVSTHLDECDECLQKVAGISSDGSSKPSARHARAGSGTAVPESTAISPGSHPAVATQHRGEDLTRGLRSPRSWRTTPTTGSSASWAVAAWASSTWRRTS